VVKDFFKPKRISLLATVFSASALAATLFLGSVNPSHADSGSCSLATLKGTYVFAYDGFHIVGGKQVSFAEAGQEKYDSNGHVAGVYSGSEGKQVSHQIRYTGTYTITPECLMNLTTKESTGDISHYDQFVSPNGSGFTFTQTDSGYVSSGWEKRVGN
jgi:hypothetical protein